MAQTKLTFIEESGNLKKIVSDKCGGGKDVSLKFV